MSVEELLQAAEKAAQRLETIAEMSAQDPFEINEQCKKCFHYQVCANVMKNQLLIREKFLGEENPKCEHFAPAEDVEKVVRCKDCINSRQYDKFSCFCDYFAENVSLSGFCSYSEKKEGLA